MKHTPTIRAELDSYLQQEGLNLARLGKLTGINRGSISAIVSGNKPMSINQLDRITEVMGLPEGHFYDLFIENYILGVPLNMRRIEPFLYRCVELNKLDMFRQVVETIMDNRIYSSKLFEIAENLFERGQYETALILYENVAEVEKYQHSERLAICQYRMFTIQIGDNQSQNVRTAAVFEAFVERLDEIDQLDALKDLANVYRSLRKWDKVEEMAKKMKVKAEVQYTLKHQQNGRERTEFTKKPTRPLFAYITYADLLCASVYEAQGDYQQALQYTYAYANLDWVIETDEDTMNWIRRYQDWSQCNIYVYKLLSGDTSVLPDYVEYIAASKVDKEMITKLLNLMFAANRYHLDVNHILERFETIIDSFVTQGSQSSDMYTKQVIPEQIARLSYELAYYYLHGDYYADGFKYLMYSMASYHTINNETYYINCLGLFEHFRTYAVQETKEKFSKFIEKVWLDNVKENDTTTHRS
ncbi:transcriptional regulator [Paenibacillus sp. CAA11]|uniref:helix-turn-helix domain-containing protein n=1 Tax=Paenibacillus sp. CAA11 TaxID=1532905 RepID=UPI000D364193|nr:helix-turn-helix transcriptional regulator [Paenibacillus sp. CAA11]AWB46432.1 transcriptional regulator [Paenibacillus sp. CAA11]